MPDDSLTAHGLNVHMNVSWGKRSCSFLPVLNLQIKQFHQMDSGSNVIKDGEKNVCVHFLHTVDIVTYFWHLYTYLDFIQV